MLSCPAVERKREHPIRPFDLARDLHALADLVEVAFKSELDATGSRMVADMRNMVRAGPLIWLLNPLFLFMARFMGGYVWTEDDKLVGNVTLSLESQHRGVWSISNVAVDPSYQGRGIARRLVAAAIQQARDEDGHWVILEVRVDNEPAQRLYRRLGFQAYDTIAELTLAAPHQHLPQEEPLKLRRRRGGDAEALLALYQRAASAKAQLIKPLHGARFRYDWEDRLEQALGDLLARHDTRHWVLEQEGQLVGSLKLVASRSRSAHKLELVVDPDRSSSMESTLLSTALAKLRGYPARHVETRISCGHAGSYDTYKAAGFEPVRILDQMCLDLRRTTRPVEQELQSGEDHTCQQALVSSP